MDNLIDARGVGVSYGGVAVLSDVDLQVRAGETLGLIGPNGAGKTTMLNALSGFVPTKTGVVRMGGRNLSRWGPNKRARHGLIRTFQDVRLFGALTVRENVVAGSLAHRRGARFSSTEIDELLAEFMLADRADIRADALPYGHERRLSIARAIAGRPSVLLLDEPAAGLNEIETDALAETLRRVRSRYECSLLVIEHHMPFIMQLCDRVQVLVGGRTIAVGAPAEIRTNKDVKDAYFGRAAV